MSGVAKRSYGTGRLYVVIDRGGRASWYGSWWAGTTRVKRKVGLKRTTGNADGLTRTQAERELRRLVDATTVVAKVEAYLHAKRRDCLSAKTVQNQLNFLHGIFAFAIRRGWATTNPVALVERPRAHRSAHRRLRFLQPQEIEAVLRAVPDDALGAVERPLYLAAAMTGLRQGELLALRWSDVDWSASRVRVAESHTRGAFDSPKSHRGRSVPMADRLAGELERHFQRSYHRGDQDLVFAHPATGHVLDPSRVRERFRAALARAGVPDITFHELRHPFGTQMAAAGAPLRAIQEWMGHADASTTEIYAHYAPDPTGGAAFGQRAFGSGTASRSPLGNAVSGMPHRGGLP